MKSCYRLGARRLSAVSAVALAVLLAAGAGLALAQSPVAKGAAATVVAGPGATDRSGAPATEAMPLLLRAGKSTVLRLPEAADRISVGNPNVADIALLKPTELYLLGKSFGTTNIILWRSSGRTSVIELQVGIDTDPLAQHIRTLWPEEKGIHVGAAGNSIVLSGGVSSIAMADQVVRLAEAYVQELHRGVAAGSPSGEQPLAGTQQAGSRSGASGASSAGAGGGARVVNLLRVLNPQQVMLEVKVAEINRSFLESLGVDLKAISNGAVTYNLISEFIAQGAASGSGLLQISKDGKTIDIKAQNAETLVNVLAEPNILTLSGHEGSFLAGGRLLVPSKTETQEDGAPSVSYTEKEYGVSLKFMPTVLENGRIHLRVSPEVSELIDRSLSGPATVLPQFNVRRATSVVQLGDGQSLAIAGLIKSNVTQQAKRLPGLGELPILGALFRSTDFINERTELVFVITPRLVKALPEDFRLPTDFHVVPDRKQLFLDGRFEGDPSKPAKPSSPAPVTDAAPAGAPVDSPAPATAPAATQPQ